MNNPIAVVILNFNVTELVNNLVRLIHDYKIIGKIIIVDNSSSLFEKSLFKLSHFSKVEIIYNTTNSGYGAGNNIGFNYLKEKYKYNYVLQINPDVEFSEDFLFKLYDRLYNDDAFIATGQPLLPNGREQSLSAWNIPSFIEEVNTLSILLNKLLKRKFIISSNISQSTIFPQVIHGSLILFNLNKNNLFQYNEKLFLYHEEQILGLFCQKNNLKVAFYPDLIFKHNHSSSIKKEFSSLFKKKVLMIKSKIVYLNIAFPLNLIKYIYIFAIIFISLIEIPFYVTIKKWIK